MKKIIAFILALILISGLCSCNIPDPNSDPSFPEDPTSETSQDQKYWEENMPLMDGSTSLIPLEVAIRSALLNISEDEATAQVSHTTTHGSYSNLLDGVVDLIYSVPLSEEQLQSAKDRNIELEQVPIAKEGFVFVVNAENPVNSLTQGQIKDIYSGKITNWKEVGGNDEEIIAYQRNLDSGSQNYMISFMGDTPLMDSPVDLRPHSMGGLMDVIAINDHAKQSIGYSVYAYAADMYGNGNEIKFIAVDGVEPSKVTMASGDYPLLSNNYAIFRADAPVDSPVRKLCDWIVSDEGQTALAKAGYVTVRDIGFDYSNSEKNPSTAYSGIGSGPLENWDMPSWQCVAATPDTINSYNYNYYGSVGAVLPLSITLPEKVYAIGAYGELVPFTTGIKYKLECLKNNELQNKINAFLDEAVKQADDTSDELYSLIERIHTTQAEEYSPYNQIYGQDELNNIYPSSFVSVKAQNGYIWATVAQMYSYDVQDGYQRYYRTKCCTWNMETGEELSVEDLFRKGLDIDEFLNDFLRKASLSPIDTWGTYPQMKTDFVSLPENGWAISPEAIYIDYDNPYFAEGQKFFFTNKDVFCSQVFCDMSEMFISNDNLVCEYYLYKAPYEPVHTYTFDKAFNVNLLDETVGNSEIRANINKNFLNKIKHINKEAVAKEINSKGHNISAEDVEIIMYGWNLAEYGNNIAIFSSWGLFDVYAGDDFYSDLSLDVYNCYIYDLQTGEELSWQDLLVKDWKDNYKIECSKEEFNGDLSSLPRFSEMSIYYSDSSLPLEFNFYSSEDGTYYYLSLPISALKLAEYLPQ